MSEIRDRIFKLVQDAMMQGAGGASEDDAERYTDEILTVFTLAKLDPTDMQSGDVVRTRDGQSWAWQPAILRWEGKK